MNGGDGLQIRHCSVGGDVDIHRVSLGRRSPSAKICAPTSSFAQYRHPVPATSRRCDCHAKARRNAIGSASLDLPTQVSFSLSILAPRARRQTGYKLPFFAK
jgi:hypothetical protein